MSALDRFGLDDAVLTTGATSGIGKGSATACVDGADLALADIDAEGLEAVAAGLGAETPALSPTSPASSPATSPVKWSASPAASTHSISKGVPAGDRPAGGIPS